jgi:hypothetical protein
VIIGFPDLRKLLSQLLAAPAGPLTSTFHLQPFTPSTIFGFFIRRYYLIDSHSSFPDPLPLLLFIMVQFSEETKVSLRSGIHAILVI